MKKKNIKQGMIVTLSACMLVNSTPLAVSAVESPEEAAEEVTEEVLSETDADSAAVPAADNATAFRQEITNFTEENAGENNQEWSKEGENGTATITHGQDGQMTIEAVNGQNYFKSNQAENRHDGVVEMDLTKTKGQTRILILFRYQDKDHWEGIGIDGNNWFYQKQNGTGNNNEHYGNLSEGNVAVPFTEVNKTYKVRIEYNDKYVSVYVDNNKIFDKREIGWFNDANSTGTVGIRLWGDSDFQSYTVDNIRTSDPIVEAVLTPASAVHERDSEYEDVTISYGGNSALTEIANGETVLNKDTDYTVNEARRSVTIKATYFESLTQVETTNLTFKFEDGQEKTFTYKNEIPEQEVSYTSNLTGFVNKNTSAAVTPTDNGLVLEGDALFIDENSQALKNQEVEFEFDPKNDNAGYGVVLRYTSGNDYFYVGPSSQNKQHFTYWNIWKGDGTALVNNYQDSGFILANRVKPYKVKVRVVDNVVTVFVDNEEIMTQEIANLPSGAGKVGFRTKPNNGMTIRNMKQENASAPKNAAAVTEHVTLTTNEMTVRLDKNFPAVVDYTLNKVSDTVVKGQEVPVHQIELNNRLYTPSVTLSASDTTSATYHVAEETTGISFDVIFRAEGNVLSMNVENIDDTQTMLYTLNFPRHSLVSMASTDPNAKLTAHNYRDKQKEIVLANAGASNAYSETTLAVLSNDKAAAAISGESYKNRHEVAYQTMTVDDHTSTGLWMNEYTYRGLDGEVMYLPSVKVAVTADCNGDKKVDVQDGAIVLRDKCMTRKVGADVVTDTWTTIAMNVGSEAQYPFLRLLDNVKKVSLAKDGFGQNLIIKGYQSEGHDAAHPDFANYNQRAGGLEDFNTLLRESEKYNAKIGIHVNHTDCYPEAPQFGTITSSSQAWDWYDVSKMIIRENDDLDKTENGLDGRFAKLYDEDTAIDGQTQIDSTYVDVFFGTRWSMYKLIDNINKRDVILGTENPDEMVSHSVFVHGIQTGADKYKGAKNLVRFVENNQSDMFQKTPLFRGIKTRNAGGDSNGESKGGAGIFGWQQSSTGNNAADFNASMDTFFCEVLPSKFLAQYPLMQYENETQAVLGENNEVVTKMENKVNIITLNDKKVAEGNKIFIPWDKGDEAQGKIYHYNAGGGSSTWKLPNSWENVTEVTLYKLTEKGKTDAKTIEVTNGEITINAEAKTGYVVYKSAESDIQTADNMDWSTGSPVKDMGFDSYNFDEWERSSTDSGVDHIQIKDNNLGNAHLYIEGTKDGKVTQTLKGLTPGQTYAASVWCTTADGRKATIEVTNGDETISNYMTRSDVKYGVHHNDKYLSYAQRMQVRFTAKSETAVLTLSAEAGTSADSKTEFDDVRVAKVKASSNPKPDQYTYWEDFENVDQGYGVFVSEEADKSHLSEKNPVNPQHTPDVIDGRYSLKMRGNSNVNNENMRTIPATVRFKPNTKYTVGIQYKSTAANAFDFSAKNENQTLATVTAADQSGKLVLEFTTPDNEYTYVDIRRKNVNPEIYVDNFYVEEARVINRETLGELIQEAEALTEENYTPESYAKMQSALEEAKKVYKNESASEEQIKESYQSLEQAVKELSAYATEEERQQLRDVIAEMKSLPESDYKTDEKWVAFLAKIEEAERRVEEKDLTQGEATQLIRDMRAAKDALNPMVDRTELKAAMEKAQRVDLNTVIDDPNRQTFIAELSTAREVDLKPGVTAEEVAAAAQNLMNAYNQIIMNDNSKAVLVAEALERAEAAEEKYFLEEDWQMIQEAKASFNEMKDQSGILVKNYFEVLDKLEAALANQSKRPVIKESMPVEVTPEMLTANSEHTGSETEGLIKYAFDKNPNTLWHTEWENGKPLTVSESTPAVVTVDFGKEYNLHAFTYLQRPVNSKNGAIQKYDLEVYTNGAWQKVITDGTFEVQTGSVSVQTAPFDPVMASQVRLTVKQGEGNFATAAEFEFLQKCSDFNELQKVMTAVDRLDRNIYLPAYYADLDRAYADAETLFDNPVTEQAVIDAATVSIQEKLNELTTLATVSDKELLEKRVQSAKELDLSKYTEDGQETFLEALREAETLLTDMGNAKKVTHTAASEKLMNLINAQNALIPKEDGTDKPDPEKPETKYVVTSVEAGISGEKTVAIGTEFDKLGLPTKAKVTIEKNGAKETFKLFKKAETSNLDIVWDQSSYNANKVGSYEIMGTIQGTETIMVPKDLQHVKYVVTVTDDSKEPGSKPDSKPGNNANDGKPAGDKNNSNTPKTGDVTNLALYVVTTLLGAGTADFIRRKKRK